MNQMHLNLSFSTEADSCPAPHNTLPTPPHPHQHDIVLGGHLEKPRDILGSELGGEGDVDTGTLLMGRGRGCSKHPATQHVLSDSEEP